MVAEFLHRMNDKYEAQVTTYREELAHLETDLLENGKFLSLLESESQKVFRDFTPREVDSRNSRQITECRETQERLEQRKSDVLAKLEETQSLQREITDALDEVKELEMAARDSAWFEHNVYNAGSEDEDPVVGTSRHMDPETASKLETILSFVLADPMRAKTELQKLL